MRRWQIIEVRDGSDNVEHAALRREQVTRGTGEQVTGEATATRQWLVQPLSVCLDANEDADTGLIETEDGATARMSLWHLRALRGLRGKTGLVRHAAGAIEPQRARRTRRNAPEVWSGRGWSR